MTRVYVGLGSNIGDARSNVLRAFSMLDQWDKASGARLSTLYRSAPVGYVDQDWFVNGVAQLDVACDCRMLMERCQQVERAMKRVRDLRWGPRIIDLDIIWMEGNIIDEIGLQIPHPRAHQRAFVLKPLAEFDPTIELNGRSVVDWLKECREQELEVCE